MDKFFPLFQTIYPNKETVYTRDRPMQVLALGLSRSGTESLSKALQQLGYEDVYHGFQLVEWRLGAIPQWYRLTKAKKEGNKEFLNKAEFDKVLGHSMAVTDVPCCGFASELMEAYPDAKVILNQRQDSAAWEKSIRKTLVGRFDAWYFKIPPWFDTGVFWTGMLNARIFAPLLLYPLLEAPDGMAKEYERHYERLRKECDGNNREYLTWQPQDGWEPLCNFLGKPVPEGPFPRGNSPQELEEFSTAVHTPRVKRALRNLLLFTVALIGAVISGLVYALRK